MRNSCQILVKNTLIFNSVINNSQKIVKFFFSFCRFRYPDFYKLRHGDRDTPSQPGGAGGEGRVQSRFKKRNHRRFRPRYVINCDYFIGICVYLIMNYFVVKKRGFLRVTFFQSEKNNVFIFVEDFSFKIFEFV